MKTFNKYVLVIHHYLNSDLLLYFNTIEQLDQHYESKRKLNLDIEVFTPLGVNISSLYRQNPFYA